MFQPYYKSSSKKSPRAKRALQNFQNGKAQEKSTKLGIVVLENKHYENEHQLIQALETNAYSRTQDHVEIITDFLENFSKFKLFFPRDTVRSFISNFTVNCKVQKYSKNAVITESGTVVYSVNVVVHGTVRAKKEDCMFLKVTHELNNSFKI